MKDSTNSDELLISASGERVVTKVAGIKRARTLQFHVNYIHLRERRDRQREESFASMALKTSPRAKEDACRRVARSI